MLESKLQYYSPENFWKKFKLWGQPVNVREQQDAFDFFCNLTDQVDEQLKVSKWYVHVPCTIVELHVVPHWEYIELLSFTSISSCLGPAEFMGVVVEMRMNGSLCRATRVCSSLITTDGCTVFNTMLCSRSSIVPWKATKCTMSYQIVLKYLFKLHNYMYLYIRVKSHTPSPPLSLHTIVIVHYSMYM